HAQVIGAYALRTTDVDASAHPRPVARDLDKCDVALGVECALDRVERTVEDRHRSIAEALDDATATSFDRDLDDLSCSPQQLDRSRVSSGQSPCRESHEVGEQQRDVAV